MRNRGLRQYAIIITIILLSFFVLILVLYDKYVLPSAITVSRKYAVTTINNEIQRSLNNCIEDMGLKSEDFIINSGYGENTAHTVNVILINQVCARIASELSNAMNIDETENIEFPIGAFTGINMLANVGPSVKVRIDQMGEATADYETVFKEAGVNQVNLEIWIEVRTDVAIVNPNWEDEMTVTRKIMLVNTIYGGKIPQTYLNIN